MKKLVVISLTIFMFVVNCQQVYAQNWQYVDSLNNGVKCYIDKSTVRHAKESIVDKRNGRKMQFKHLSVWVKYDNIKQAQSMYGEDEIVYLYKYQVKNSTEISCYST